MTDTRMTQTEERPAGPAGSTCRTMLLIGGTLSIIYGFVALFNDNW